MCSHGPVDGYEGNMFFYMQIGIVGETNNPIYLVLLCDHNIFLLQIGIVIGGAEKHPVFPFQQGCVDMINKLCKKGIGCIGDQQSDCIGFAGFQPLRIAVHVVVKLPDRVLYTKPVGFSYRQSVDDLGYSSQRDSCFQRDVFHCGGGVFLSHNEFLSGVFLCCKAPGTGSMVQV